MRSKPRDCFLGVRCGAAVDPDSGQWRSSKEMSTDYGVPFSLFPLSSILSIGMASVD